MLLLTCIVHVKKQGKVERKQTESSHFHGFYRSLSFSSTFLIPFSLCSFLPSFFPLFLQLVTSHFLSLAPFLHILFLPPCFSSFSSLSILSLSLFVSLSFALYFFHFYISFHPFLHVFPPFPCYLFLLAHLYSLPLSISLSLLLQSHFLFLTQQVAAVSPFLLAHVLTLIRCS